MTIELVPHEPLTVESAQDEIAQYAAILASMLSPKDAAEFLDDVARDLRNLQPVEN